MPIECDMLTRRALQKVVIPPTAVGGLFKSSLHKAQET